MWNTVGANGGARSAVSPVHDTGEQAIGQFGPPRPVDRRPAPHADDDMRPLLAGVGIVTVAAIGLAAVAVAGRMIDSMIWMLRLLQPPPPPLLPLKNEPYWMMDHWAT